VKGKLVPDQLVKPLAFEIIKVQITFNQCCSFASRIYNFLHNEKRSKRKINMIKYILIS